MRRIVIILIFILVLISIDIISKNYVTSMPSGGYTALFGEYIGLQLSYNPGIAFSLPITGLPLQIITILVVIWLIWYYIRYEYAKNSHLIDTAYWCIFAWALSHAYERIFVGHVIDFISVKYFAILNFADIFISIGACLIFFVYYVRKQ